MIVVQGSASPRLSSKLAKELRCGLVKPKLDRFPDGESYVRIDHDFEGEHAIVVQSTPYPQNDNYMELFLLLDTVKDLGASRVTAVVPYLGYARQDKRFKPGEAVSIHTICKLIKWAGADDLFTIDIHQDETMRSFAIPAYNLSAMTLIGKYLKRLELRDIAILGPDQGALRWARKTAAELLADYDYLEKKRLTPKKVVVRPKRLDIAGRDVAIVDDIISTGGTVIEAIKLLKKQKARNIYVACTHPVLVGDALRKIKRAGARKVFATDTIESKISEISVAPLIADAIS